MDDCLLADKYIKQASDGRDVWLKIKSKYNWSDNMFLVIAYDDERLINCSINYLPFYLQKRQIPKALFVVDKSSRCDSSNSSMIEIIKMDSESIECLTRFYRLTQFTENIRVISKTLPFGSEGIIGKCGITIEKYVKNVIFGV